MKQKALIAHSLAFVLGGEIAISQECNITTSYACFKYNSILSNQSTPQRDWMSYRDIGNSIFLSLEDLNGQILPRDGQNTLSIANKNSTLILKNVFQDNAIVISVPKDATNIFSLSSKDSVIFGNIAIEAIQKEVSMESKIANLFFDGGKHVDLKYLREFERSRSFTHRKTFSQILENKYDDDRKWSLIGSITNSSRGKINIDFKDGAKMLGDLYAYHSQVKVVFHHSLPIPSSFFSHAVIFEGGIYNLGGRIDIDIQGGGIRAVSLGAEDFGILAESGGVNVLTFTDIGDESNPQHLFASQIIAQNNQSNNSKTQNIITFKNSQSHENNLAQTYDMIADSGINIIQTMDAELHSNTELNLIIERSIISIHNPNTPYSSESKLGNFIIIDGSLKVGEYAMKTIASSDEIFGILAWSGSNVIKLKDTFSTYGIQDDIVASDNNPKSGYYENRTLITPRIYAGADEGKRGINHIEVGGDLKLMYLEGKGNYGRSVIGAEIIASEGGSNTIIVNGKIDVIGYKTRLDDSIGTLLNKERDEKDLFHTFIGAYGRTVSSKNTIVIRNTDIGGAFNGSGFEDLILGDVVAYGGSNELTLYAPLCEDWKGIEIKSLIAGNQDRRGNRYLDGINDVLITNGVDITIKKIETHAGGENRVWILQNENISDIVQTSDLAITYGEGGKTSLHFGIGEDRGKLSSDMQINLDSWGGKKNLNLSVSKNREDDFETYGISISGSFYGGFDYTTKPTNTGYLAEINYALEDDSVFVGEIVGDNRVEQSIVIGNGAKFVPKNQEKIELEALAIDTSSKYDTQPLKRTLFMDGSIIDLATIGGSYTNISGKDNIRVLDIQAFVIHKDEKHNPLIRYHVSDTHQADQIIVGKINTNKAGLNAQVFLPTSLIGYDFTRENISIFSTQSGGENLEITSLIAQTGIVTYKTEILKVSAPNPTDPKNSLHYWKLGKSKDVKISEDFINLAGMFLVHNYGLFQIHFNSLNKRMGELRDEDEAHGVWGRAFGGEQVNEYGYKAINSKYFVFQAGYDRSFDVRGGSDFVGITLSYGIMDSKSKAFVGNYLFNFPFAYNAFSHSMEVGAYNVYFHTSGFYTDSIAKLGFLLTRFRGVNENSVSACISNFTFTVGQEFGYQFRFGANKEWFITPQYEMILSYLTRSDLKQEYDGQTLHSALKGVLTFRNRLGSEVGYTLARSKAEVDFKLGVSYEIDYAKAWASFSVLGANYVPSVIKSSFISPDQKMILNCGTNLRIGKSMRLYFDVESSFFGKIRTKYQLNAGIRYSFGERMHRLTPEERAKQNFIKLIAE